MAEETKAGGAEALELRREDDRRTLVAVFHPDRGAPMDEETLRKAITDRGFGQFPLIEPALTAFLDRQAGATEPYGIIIGGKRNGKATVRIAKDQLAAYLKVAPAVGEGQKLSREDILGALREAEVVEGILEEVIDQAARAAENPVVEWVREDAGVVVARGREPRDGEDGRLEGLIPNVADRRPRVLENGTVDYRDFGEVVTVNPGTAFVRALPPVPGEDGVTVTGERLVARQGKPVKLKPMDQSTELSEGDTPVLMAKITGQPVILPNGAKVEPIFRVDEVAVASGNVLYDGTVVVKGDVRTGMKIEVSGDIKVGGVVEGASLTAGGDVIVGGGIIGRGGVRDARGEIRPDTAVIKSAGFISARFIDNALVDARGDVIVRDLIRHSEVTSAGQVIVGGGSSSKGQIIGGVTRARSLVQTAVLGAPASVHTEVEVGNRAELKRQIREVEEELRVAQERLQKVEGALGQAKNNPKVGEEMMGKLKLARRQLLAQIGKLKEDSKRLNEESQEAVRAQIIAGKKVFNNVHVIMDGKTRSVEEERNSVTFVLEGGGIEFR